MKVLMISPNYAPITAGAELFAQKVAEYLSKRGEDVYVITRKVKNHPNIEDINGVIVHRTSLFRVKDYKSADAKLSLLTSIPYMALRILKIIKKYDIELIHGHGVIANFVGLTASKICYKPFIATDQQGGDYATYNPTIGDNIILENVIKYIMRNSTVVHGVSRYVVEYTKKLGAKNTILIPNGIDINIFKPDIGGKNYRKKFGVENNNIVVTVSRLSPKNGVHLLLKAAPQILKEKTNTKFVIVGGGPQEKELKDLTEKLSICDKVIFTGDVPHAEIPKYMDMADVFIRPSLAEGLGIVFLEAMACGTPTIGTRVGGIVDIIKDEENGLLIEPDSESGIKASILKLLTDTNLAKKLSKKGREDVKKYAWDNLCGEMYEVYRELIGEKK